MAPIGATRAAKNPTQPRVVENPLITPCVDSVDTKTSNPTNTQIGQLAEESYQKRDPSKLPKGGPSALVSRVREW